MPTNKLFVKRIDAEHMTGFSLIELLISVAILGILAAIAVPAYQTYLIKARVAEGFHLVESAKLAVAEATLVHNALPSAKEVVGYTTAVATQNVASVFIGDQGLITISYTPLAGAGTLILTPVLHPTGELSWSCTAGTLDAKYRPATCRG